MPTPPPSALPRPLALAVAPNGGRLSRLDHPALPVSAAEIAHTAAACLEAGAAMIHLHVRDAGGRHVLDAGLFREVAAAIDAAVGDRLVVQMTTEAIGRYDTAAQMAVVKEARPEAVSLALREFAPDAAGEASFAGFLEWIRRERIAPQFIVYSAAEAVRLGRMIRSGTIPWAAPPVLVVLGGRAAGQAASPRDLEAFHEADVPRFAEWMVCAFGPLETSCLVAAARRGADVRVGFENNLHQPDGSIAPDNAARVKSLAAALRETDRPLCSAESLRERWSRC